MKRFALLRRARALRLLLGIGLFALIPTVGVLFTCVVGILPVVAAVPLAELFPALDGLLGVTSVIIGAVMWLAAAAGVALGSLRGFRWLSALRPRLGAVSVGSDGLAIRTGFFAKKFIAWKVIEAVAVDETAPTPCVVLSLDDGTEERLPVEGLEELRSAVDDALAATEGHEQAPRLAELEPAADLKDWLATARELASEGSYRDGSREPELLVRIAEDPTAPAAQRIGSALALSNAAEPIKVRVRAAVEQTAQEEVADAMEEALSGKLRVRSLTRAIEE